ncbi:MAG TPA: TolC family protein [Tepidisphaeraceae bacterium]|nr:TolC family protein [Tepidisphaeraceae bacterium]
MSRTIALTLGAALLGGCATVPKHAGFEQVQHQISDRTDHLVQWRGNTSEDAQVDSAVALLLAKEMSADDAVQIALLNNRHLQAKFEDLGVAQADLVQAGLLSNPVFVASARFPDHSPRSTNSEFSVTQDFLDLIVLPMRKKVAAQQFESTKLFVAHEVLQLAADVKTAYYTLQAREQLIARLHAIAELNQAAAELASKQYEAGTLNELDLASQEALADQSKIDVSQAEAQLAIDREHFNRLLGLSGAEMKWKVAPKLPEIPQQAIAGNELESVAMRDRLDLAATREQVASFASAVGVASANRYFSSVEIGIDTEKEPDGVRVTGPELSLQIPIFDQGQAKIAKAQAELRQLQRRYEAAVIDTKSEVREGRDRMLAQRALVEHYRQLLPRRIHIVNLTLQHYNGMLKGPYDLLLAKQNELAAEQASIEALRDYWIARADLERAVGGRLPAGTTASTTHPASLPVPSSPQQAPVMHQHAH